MIYFHCPSCLTALVLNIISDKLPDFHKVVHIIAWINVTTFYWIIIIYHLKLSLNALFFVIFFSAVVVSNITRGPTLFLANQLRVDVSWRFLLAHPSCVRLHVWRHSGPMVVDIGLVNAIGCHLLVLVAANQPWTHVRVSKK